MRLGFFVKPGSASYGGHRDEQPSKNKDVAVPLGQVLGTVKQFQG